MTRPVNQKLFMEPDLSRRALLKGRLHRVSSDLLPPWAVQEFHSLCNRCNDCVETCPESVLVRGDGGFPKPEFSHGECTFCGLCRDRCKPGALAANADLPWHYRASVTTSRCLSANGTTCRSCSDSCEQRAIRFRIYSGSRAEPQINDDLCNGCGSCIAPCPVNALVIRNPV